MTARDEAVVGRAGVHIEGGLHAHGQLDDAGVAHADGAGLAPHPVPHIAPLVPTLDMTAVEIDVGLVLGIALNTILPWYHQSVETHGTLGSTSVEVVHEQLQLSVGGTAGQASTAPPQQGRTADVYQGPVYKLTGLVRNVSSLGGCRPALPETIDPATHTHLPPHPWLHRHPVGVVRATEGGLRVHDKYSIGRQTVHTLVICLPLGGLLSQEDIPTGVKARGEYCDWRRGSVPRGDDPAGEPRDGGLGRGLVGVLDLVPGYGVHHHKVNGRLGAPPDLKQVRAVVLRIFHNDSLGPVQGVGDRMLFGVKDGLRGLRSLDDIMLGSCDAIGFGSTIQHKLGPPPALVSLRQSSIVTKNHKLSVFH